MSATKKRHRSNPGPTADCLKLDGDWQDAVKRALGVERPPEGFPIPEPRYKARRKAGKAAGKAKNPKP
jgi:hypothetical protein